MSTPFSEKKFTFTQPDGTELWVKGWGNQRHAVFECLNGYTIVKDPITGFYVYADLSSDGEATHLVQSDEALSAIANKYGTSVDKIVEANTHKFRQPGHKITRDWIEAGWVLNIPD